MSVNGSAAKALCEQGAETFPKATALQHLSSRLVKAGHALQVVGLAGMAAMLILNHFGM